LEKQSIASINPIEATILLATLPISLQANIRFWDINASFDSKCGNCTFKGFVDQGSGCGYCGPCSGCGHDHYSNI